MLEPADNDLPRGRWGQVCRIGALLLGVPAYIITTTWANTGVPWSSLLPAATFAAGAFMRLYPTKVSRVMHALFEGLGMQVMVIGMIWASWRGALLPTFDWELGLIPLGIGVASVHAAWRRDRAEPGGQ